MIFTMLKKNKKRVLRVCSVFLAVLVWQALAYFVGSELLLTSPVDVFKRILQLFSEDGFFGIVGFTFSKIALGFFLGLVLGAALALLAGRFWVVEMLLWPYMVTIKSIPVASFVVLALIWLSGSELAWFISFLMVLPIIYTNLLEGIKSVDKKMLEMADVFKMPFSRRLRFIWMPAVEPFLLSGVRISLGLAWKSGVAAELIGYPEGSVGEALYYSKLFLDTASLFAWTVVIVLISVCFEKLFMCILKKGFKAVKSV